MRNLKKEKRSRCQGTQGTNVGDDGGCLGHVQKLPQRVSSLYHNFSTCEKKVDRCISQTKLEFYKHLQ